MKDNLENLKEISDIVLKDIYASDELKRKTLEKCTANKRPKISAAILSTASAAVLMIAIGLYNYSFQSPNVAINNPVNNQTTNEYKNPVDIENSVPAKTIAENKPDEKVKSTDSSDKTVNLGTGAGNKDVAIQSSGNAAGSSGSTSKNQIEDTQHSSSSSNEEHALASSIKPLSITDAEKYFGSKILFPQYVPEGFILTSISVPNDKEKCVKLKYSTRTAYFEILENKNLSELEGNKTILLGSNKAYVNYTKDDSSNNLTTITWSMNSIQYSLSGNLPESFLINIGKYLN